MNAGILKIALITSLVVAASRANDIDDSGSTVGTCWYPNLDRAFLLIPR